MAWEVEAIRPLCRSARRTAPQAGDKGGAQGFRLPRGKRRRRTSRLSPWASRISPPVKSSSTGALPTRGKPSLVSSATNPARCPCARRPRARSRWGLPPFSCREREKTPSTASRGREESSRRRRADPKDSTESPSGERRPGRRRVTIKPPPCGNPCAQPRNRRDALPQPRCRPQGASPEARPAPLLPAASRRRRFPALRPRRETAGGVAAPAGPYRLLCRLAFWRLSYLCLLIFFLRFLTTLPICFPFHQDDNIAG